MVDMSSLIGTVRRFGLSGPPYEILGVAPGQENGEAQMRIWLIESGEEALYPVSAILSDPKDD